MESRKIACYISLLSFRKIEKALDNAHSGPVWLKDRRIAKEVADSIHYLDEKVMPEGRVFLHIPLIAKILSETQHIGYRCV